MRAERTAGTPPGETGPGEAGSRAGRRTTGGRGARPSYRNYPGSPLTPGWLCRPPDSKHTRLVIIVQPPVSVRSQQYFLCQGYPGPGYQSEVPPPAPGPAIPAGYPGQYPQGGYHQGQGYLQQYDRDQGNSSLLTISPVMSYH